MIWYELSGNTLTISYYQKESSSVKMPDICGFFLEQNKLERSLSGVIWKLQWNTFLQIGIIRSSVSSQVYRLPKFGNATFALDNWF